MHVYDQGRFQEIVFQMCYERAKDVSGPIDGGWIWRRTNFPQIVNIFLPKEAKTISTL